MGPPCLKMLRCQFSAAESHDNNGDSCGGNGSRDVILSSQLDAARGLSLHAPACSSIGAVVIRDPALKTFSARSIA